MAEILFAQFEELENANVTSSRLVCGMYMYIADANTVLSTVQLYCIDCTNAGQSNSGDKAQAMKCWGR